MRRARIIAVVAVPVLLLGAGCRGGIGAGAGGGAGDDPAADSPVTGSADTGSGESGGSGGAGVEQQFDDIESTLSSIESEMAQDGR